MLLNGPRAASLLGGLSPYQLAVAAPAAYRCLFSALSGGCLRCAPCASRPAAELGGGGGGAQLGAAASASTHPELHPGPPAATRTAPARKQHMLHQAVAYFRTSSCQQQQQLLSMHTWQERHRPQGPAEACISAVGQQYGVPDSAAYLNAVQKLPVPRQFALLEHASGVAQHLRRLGIGSEQVARLLQHCPALFSWAAEERAQVLLSEMMGSRVGLSACQAVEVFVRCPALGNTRNLMPSIVKLVAEQHAVVQYAI